MDSFCGALRYLLLISDELKKSALVWPQTRFRQAQEWRAREPSEIGLAHIPMRLKVPVPTTAALLSQSKKDGLAKPRCQNDFV